MLASPNIASLLPFCTQSPFRHRFVTVQWPSGHCPRVPYCTPSYLPMPPTYPLLPLHFVFFRKHFPLLPDNTTAYLLNITNLDTEKHAKSPCIVTTIKACQLNVFSLFHLNICQYGRVLRAIFVTPFVTPSVTPLRFFVPYLHKIPHHKPPKIVQKDQQENTRIYHPFNDNLTPDKPPCAIRYIITHIVPSHPSPQYPHNRPQSHYSRSLRTVHHCTKKAVTMTA